MRKATMKNKVDIKKLLPVIACLVVIIVVIIVIVAVTNSNNKKEESPNIENQGVEDVENDAPEEEPQENSNMGENSENNESSLDVPQKDTSSVGEYVDNSGQQIAGDTVESIQAQIEEKFRSIPLEKLQLKGVDLDSAKIMFGEGVMSIANKECFGFSVYVLDGEYMKSAGTYAMSTDTEVLYRYDTKTMTYIFVNMN